MRVSIFGDESGNFDFSRKRGASRYFILTTLAVQDCNAMNLALQDLRHQMAWEGHDHAGPFHAAHDPGPVRNRVFGLLETQTIQVDALIMEKAKAMPHIRATEERFYQHAWYYLLRHVIPSVPGEEIFVVSASLGQKKKRDAFYATVRDVMKQVGNARRPHRTASWDSKCDGCLQAADYCGWAIQRKWEYEEAQPYLRIANKVRSEFDVFSRGKVFYY